MQKYNDWWATATPQQKAELYRHHHPDQPKVRHHLLVGRNQRQNKPGAGPYLWTRKPGKLSGKDSAHPRRRQVCGHRSGSVTRVRAHRMVRRRAEGKIRLVGRLRNRTVVIFPDDDDEPSPNPRNLPAPGFGAAIEIAKNIRGIADSVQIRVPLKQARDKFGSGADIVECLKLCDDWSGDKK